jgi:hypothetical protein
MNLFIIDLSLSYAYLDRHASGFIALVSFA